MVKFIRIMEELRKLEKMLSPLLGDIGLSFSQIRMCYQVYKMAPVTSSQLSKELGITNASTTNQLKELARAGLVKTIPNPEDKRSSLVSLTSNGEKRLELAMEAIYEMEKKSGENMLKPFFDAIKQMT